MALIRINTIDITIRRVNIENTDIDPIFKEPSTPGDKEYHDPVILYDAAQYISNKFEKVSFSDKNNISYESNPALVFTYEDWKGIEEAFEWVPQKGDRIITIGPLTDIDFIIEEVRPKSFLHGEPLLILVSLRDYSRRVGSVK